MNGNDRSIVGLVSVAHAMVHTYELSLPILVPVWLGTFDTTTAVLGLVVSVGYGLFGLGALPAGVLADRYGSQRLVVACLFGMGASFLLLGLASSLPAVVSGLPTVVAALVVWGVAASVYHPSGLSLISTGVVDRGSAFAYHGVAGNLGTALGPLATTLLLVVLDWQVVVGVLAVPALLAGLFALRVDVDETAATPAGGGAAGSTGSTGEKATDGGRGTTGIDSLGEFLTQSRVLFAGAFVGVFGVVMASGLYYRGVLTFLPELFRGFDAFAPVELGGRTLEPGDYVYSGLLMVGVLGQYVGGRLTDRIRTEAGIAVGFATLCVLALVFLPVANAGLVPLLALSAVLGFTLFALQPLYQATVANYTPAGARGLSYGYTYLGVFGVGALGAPLAGFLLTISTGALFGVLAVLAALGALLGVVLFRRVDPSAG